MKYSSKLVIAAFIGNEVAVRTVKALSISNHDLVDEDYFDRHYTEDEKKLI